MVEKAPAVLGSRSTWTRTAASGGQTAPGVHWMVVHKIRELKDRGLRVGLLTNNVKEFGEHWRAMFPIDELCDEVVDSSHVGDAQARTRDLRAHVRAHGRSTPTEAVFVDDNADNVAAARAYGMEAVHFGEDPWDALAELDAILDRRGVTTVARG